MKVSKNYMIFSIIFVACLLMTNIAAVKTIAVGPVTLTAAVILFPVTYIVNDILAEVYGLKKARFTIFMGFAMNILMVVFFAVTIIIPAPEYFTLSDAYSAILGNTPRLLIASLLAYLVGSNLNAVIMTSMHEAHGDKKLFARCILSTLVGETCDSTVFVTVGFAFVLPWNAILTMIICQAVFKTLYEVVIYPVTHVVIKKVKEIENGTNA